MDRPDGLRISSAYVNFEREVLHDNIELCDQKSGLLMAISSVLVIFCLQSLPIPERVEHSLSSPLLWTMDVLYAVGILGFTVSAYLGLRVVAPRVRGHTNDHIYWMSRLFELPEKEFLTRIHEAGDWELERDMALHLKTLAAICRSKYRVFNWAQYVAEFSFAAVVIAEAIRVFA